MPRAARRTARLRRHPTPPSGVLQAIWESFTPFQRAVYRAVCEIPPGQTRSYQWVARRIGRPRAARAVGQALHVNPCAPMIPCHRVIQADGTPGGYARGVRKKRALLQQEQTA